MRYQNYRESKPRRAQPEYKRRFNFCVDDGNRPVECNSPKRWNVETQRWECPLHAQATGNPRNPTPI